MAGHHPSLHLHLSKKKQKNLLDKVVLVSSFVYPFTAIPQVLVVYRGDTEGVSLISWISFTCFAVLFLVYGLVHKIKPMIVTNVLWLIIDALVVIGIMFHRF